MRQNHLKVLEFTLAAVLWAAPARAAVIDFEDLPLDELVFSQYAERGVTFPQAPRIVAPAAGTQSGTQALTKHHPGQEFDGHPLTIEFTVLQDAVSLYAGVDWSSAGYTWDAELVAYDGNDNVVAQDAVTLPAGPAPIETLLSVSTASRVIRRVELLYVGSAFEIIDDLTFSHEANGGPDDTTPPQVFIETPFDGMHLDSFTTGMMEFPLDGYVIEDIMLKSLTIDVEGPGGQTNHGTLSTWNGPPRYDFGAPHVHGLIFSGHNRITVTAEDFGGNVGVATVDVYFQPLEGLAELLILYPEELRGPLPWLKAWKDISGVPTGMISVEALDVDPRFAGAHDLPEKIKLAIAYAYENNATRYVMLIGDADKFPIRYVRNGRQGVSWGVCWTPSDLYYADLYDQNGQFDDWDLDDDGVYGTWWGPAVEGDPVPDFAFINKDDVDLRPDVAVGRVPASTKLEVIRYVAKVFDYELSFGGSWFYDTVLFNGSEDWWNDHDAIARVAQNSMPGFNHQQCLRPSGYESMSDANKAVAFDALRACVHGALGQGRGFAGFFGHGGHNTMGYVVNASDVDQMTIQTDLPVFFARACDTAKFNFIFDDYEDIDGNFTPYTDGWHDPRPEPKVVQPHHVDIDSMAEAMLLRNMSGAVGYIGAHSGIHEAGIPLSEAFFESRDRGHTRLGDMWNDSVTRFADERLYSGDWMGRSPYMSHHIHKFLLFGDPSLRVGGIPEEDLVDLYNGETQPEEIQTEIQIQLNGEVSDFRNLSYPDYIRTEIVSLTGETQGRGLVRLYEDRELLVEARADDSGRFRMELPRLDEGNHKLKLVLESKFRPSSEETIRIGVYRTAPEAKNVQTCDVCGPRDVLVTGETQYDGTTVELLEDGRSVGIVNSRHGGRFEIRTSSVLDDGEHGFVLRLTDAAGNVTDVPGTITVTIACKGDECAPTCDEGLENCDGSCVDLTGDTTNCGACGNACADGQICQDGDCQDDCGNDCGTDPDTNPDPSSGCSTTSSTGSSAALLGLLLLAQRTRRTRRIRK